VITRGYPIIKQSQTNQNLYLIQSGKVALYCKHPKGNNEAFLYLKTLKTGQMFNFNCVNSASSPFLIEAYSPEVKVYKVQMEQLINNFDST
jgi:signal-transduction protein with cAMP-binding, CBS, and nucleotidyltransferase domain